MEIYEGSLGFWDNPQNARLNIGIDQLLLSDKHCRIDGVSILMKGTPEWQSELDVMKFRLNAKLEPEQVQENLEREASNPAIFKETEFTAINYWLIGDNKYDIPKRVFYDTKRKVLCEINPLRRRADMFKLTERWSKYLGSWIDGAHKKAGFEGLYSFTGSFEDVANLFFDKGYKFSLWDTVWQPDYIINGERTTNSSPIIVNENVLVEDAIEKLKVK